MARFGRVLSAMVTPFDADGGLDLDAARTVARWLESHGNDGLVVAGTTGEAPVLSDEEKLSLWAAVAEAVTIPVIAGTGSNDTAHSVHLTREASALGVAGVMAVCPYYNRPSQAGLDAHFRAVAAATDLPVVIYDIPIRTGRKITTATLLRLAHEVPNVLVLKDAAGNPGETAALVSSAPEGYEVYSGDDGMTLPLLASGAVGVIGVATHWTGIGPPGPVRSLGEGRRGRRPSGQLPAPGELRLRDRRRDPQPAAHQGHAQGAGAAGRPGPPADGPGAGGLGGPRPGGARQPGAVAGRVPRPP